MKKCFIVPIWEELLKSLCIPIKALWWGGAVEGAPRTAVLMRAMQRKTARNFILWWFKWKQKNVEVQSMADNFGTSVSSFYNDLIYPKTSWSKCVDACVDLLSDPRAKLFWNRASWPNEIPDAKSHFFCETWFASWYLRFCWTRNCYCLSYLVCKKKYYGCLLRAKVRPRQ